MNRPRLLAFLLLSLSSLAVAADTDPTPAAARGIDREAWVAARSDGSPGKGTPDDPFDGSTAARFDRLMDGFPPRTAIHLLPGLYLTGGWGDGMDGAEGGFLLKPGQKVLGSGMGVTVLRLATLYWSGPGPARHRVLSGPANMHTDGAEVSGLTIDCNGNRLPLRHFDALDGVRLEGNDCAIRDVEVLHARATADAGGLEGFAISIGTGDDHAPSVTGALIERCRLKDSGAFVVGISLGRGPNAASTVSGTVRDCLVQDLAWTAYSGGGLSGAVFEGNTALNCDFGFRIDTGDNRDVVLAHNVFRTLRYPPIQIIPAEGAFDRFVIEGNLLEGRGDGIPAIWMEPARGIDGAYFGFRVADNIYHALGKGQSFVLLTRPNFKNVLITGNIADVPNRIANADPSVCIKDNLQPNP